MRRNLHPDPGVRRNLKRLVDSIARWNRRTGRRSALVFRDEDGFVFRALDGRPGALDGFADRHVLAPLNGVAGIKNKALPTPTHPFVFVLNATTVSIRQTCDCAGVLFRIGPHQGGERYAKGLYVHSDDLSKLADYLTGAARPAEAKLVRQAMAKNLVRQAMAQNPTPA